MVPATFVQLQALPMNASGKVDRAALPLPSTENMLRDNAFVAPRTPIENECGHAGAASRVGSSQYGDNFFFLGGILCWARR